LASDWVQNVFRFLKGDLPAERLIKLAPNKPKETEAHTYVALDLAGRGQRAQAIQHLQWVVDHGSNSVYEYRVAVAWYQRLRGSTP